MYQAATTNNPTSINTCSTLVNLNSNQTDFHYNNSRGNNNIINNNNNDNFFRRLSTTLAEAAEEAPVGYSALAEHGNLAISHHTEVSTSQQEQYYANKNEDLLLDIQQSETGRISSGTNFDEPIERRYQQERQLSCNEQTQGTLTLDEIGAILNSKEFSFDFQHEAGDHKLRPTALPCTPVAINQNNHCLNGNSDSDNNQNFTKQEIHTPNEEKTKAAIYEHLRRSIEGTEDLGRTDNDDRILLSSNNNHPNLKLTTGQSSSGETPITDKVNNIQDSSRTTNLMKNISTTTTRNNNMAAKNNGLNMDEAQQQPFVEIIEQPAKCALRFRYKCEGRSAGSLPGVNSTADQKTYPSIRINNYTGRAVVVISCVTKEAPYLAHPHNLVGKEGCKKGICTIVINNYEAQMVRSFSGLGIQCVKRKDIEESLNLRESINVDPFRNGFQHKLNSSNIDLNVVRLCFQVFIEGSTPNKCDVPLRPVVSDSIHDKKAMSDLIITKLSHCSAPASGGREVILLCDRIARDDIQLRFYEEREGKLIWETYMDISPTDVHKQVAICFKSPKYYNENIQQPVMARLQLKRLSDQQMSEPRLFQFLPCESEEDMVQRKRQKIEWANMNHYVLDNILLQQQPNCSTGNPLLPVPQVPQLPLGELSMHRQHHLQQQHQQPASNLLDGPFQHPNELQQHNNTTTTNTNNLNHLQRQQAHQNTSQHDAAASTTTNTSTATAIYNR